MDAVAGSQGTERRRQRGGFTMIEVVIAMAVLAVGLLGVAAMQIYALRDSGSARHKTRAAGIARTQLESFANMPFSDPLMAATSGWSSPPVVVNQEVAASTGTQIEQSYNVQWRISNLNLIPTLKSVDVRVTWNEPNRPNRNVTLSTMRFEN